MNEHISDEKKKIDADYRKLTRMTCWGLDDIESDLKRQRHIKIALILKAVKECNKIKGKSVSKKKLIAECGSMWGNTQRKILEYLDELVGTQEIVIDRDDIWTWERFQEFNRSNQRGHEAVRSYFEEIGEEGIKEIKEKIKNG